MALCLRPSLIKVMYGAADRRIRRTCVNYHQTRERGVDEVSQRTLAVQSRAEQTHTSSSDRNDTIITSFLSHLHL